MDLFKSMSIFVKVADLGSFTAAASAVHMSATMVGNHLQALEERLGMRLINRTTRRQSLTDFGQTYLEQCREVLRLVAEADADALANHSLPRGRLRVTAPTSFGAEVLMPAIGDYCARYPDVDLDITLCDRTVDLIEEGFEAAIRIGKLPDSGLLFRNLRPYSMMICASPEYLKLHGVPSKPDELSQHQCIAFSTSSGQAWSLTSAAGTVRIAVQGRIQVNNGQALRVAALRGLGIIMQPAALLAQDVAEGRLVQLLPEYELPSRPMQIVFLRNQHMSLKLRSFIDFVVECWGK